MKIPLYRRQTQMTRDSGARNLTAMASGSDYAAPANAAFRLGATGVETGKFLADVGITEVKQENATILATEEAKFSKKIYDMQTDAVMGPVGQSKAVPNPSRPAGYGPKPGNLTKGPPETMQQHMLRYQSSLIRETNSQANRISDTDVRRRFKTAAAEKVRASMPGIRTQLRSRYLDQHRAVTSNLVVEQRRALERFTFPDGTGAGAMHQQIVNKTELFIRETGRAEGETQVNIEKKVREFRSDVVEDHIRDELLTHRETNNPEGALGLSTKIGNYANSNSPFKDLSPDAARRLQKDASDQHRIDDARVVRDAERQERQEEKTKKQDSVTEARRISNMINVARANNKPVNISPSDIQNSTILLPKSKQAIINAIKGNDAVYNPAQISTFKSEIRNAFNENELDQVEERIEEAHANTVIGNKGYDAVIKYLDSAKKNAPGVVEEKRYLGVVKQALGLKTLTPGGMSFGQNDILSAKQALALTAYEDLVDNGERPAAAAYQIIVDTIEESEEVAKDLAKSLPPELKSILQTDAGVPRVVTTADVPLLKAKWRELFLGKTQNVNPAATQLELADAVKEKTIKRSDRIRARQLFAVESKIKAIEQALNKVAVAKGKESEDSGETPATGQTNWEAFKGYFTGSELAPGKRANR
tara:strand:+ start:148 stop:2091 length:1944 start_codon:yes stop_codon:yes gene_type:complete